MAETKPNEITLTRIFDAPVSAVWDAWTDPKQVSQWWGPRGFTITTHRRDLRAGGTWVYTMHGPDGVDYPNTTLYHEVVKHSRLVYDHGATDTEPPKFHVTVLFSELGKKTRMQMTMRLATAEAAAETREFIKRAGGNSTWDRLAEYLTHETTGKEEFVINRTFAAPIDVMFKMWTDPAHFSQWLAPKGFSMKFIRPEIHQGGTSFYSMTDGKTITMYGRVHYLEIAPTRLVYTQQFCDEHERVTRHFAAPTWPETMLTTVTFAEEGPKETRVTVNWEPYGAATAEDVATFVKARSGMTMGWTGSFDKLDAHLEGAVAKS